MAWKRPNPGNAARGRAWSMQWIFPQYGRGSNGDLQLPGHIHECRGEARIGRTLAINPGREYSEGVLRGAIIMLSRRKGVRGYQLVAG